MRLVPFVFTARQNLTRLRLDDLDGVGDAPLERFFVDDEGSRTFGEILNFTNQLAFGGETNMGMPLWVLLDCGILPSAVVGYALERGEVSDELARELGVPDGYDGLVPISEYCACPTIEPHCVSGFSLQTQVTGVGIGTRTKALALLIYRSRAQIGVTQFDNPSIRVHARFGPMRMTIHRPSIHTHAHNSFAYRVDLPGDEHLLALARGDFGAILHDVPEGEGWSFDPSSEEDHARLGQLLGEGAEVWISPPGWRAEGDGCRLDLIVTSSS